MTTLITGPEIHIENGELCATDLVIEQQKIAAFVPVEMKYQAAKTLHFPATWHLIPGMIDLHIHGVSGKDVMDMAHDATTLATMSQSLAAEGTTAFLATTVAAPITTIEKVLQATYEYFNSQTDKIIGAEVLGINLEGPFLSLMKKGAQAAEWIISPDLALLQHWIEMAPHLIKSVTLAAEVPKALGLINYLRNHGIIAALGHSNATYEQTLTAIASGVSHATHLFNAMHSISQRDPGNALALLLADNISVELIADEVHLHAAFLQLVWRIKKISEIILITDAMRAKNLGDGEYELGGQKVCVHHGVAKLSDGTLAGSILRMDQALRNIMRLVNCSLHEALRMTAVNPAKKLNLFDSKGSIAVGKDADLVVLDENYQVQCTLCRGEVVYQKLRIKN